MGIHRSVTGGIQVLTCTGELALGKGDGTLVDTCDEVLAEGARFLVLDLTPLAYVDSSGIGAIVRCSKRAADRAAVIRLVVPSSGPVRKVLTFTHLDRAFDVFGTVEQAVKDVPR